MSALAPSRILEDAVVGTFSMQKMSLTPMGMPSRAPRVRPLARRASDSLASCSARSLSVYTNMLSLVVASICSMQACVSSTDDTAPCWSALDASRRLARHQALTDRLPWCAPLDLYARDACISPDAWQEPPKSDVRATAALASQQLQHLSQSPQKWSCIFTDRGVKKAVITPSPNLQLLRRSITQAWVFAWPE